ncbi:protein neprosin-like isoform X1 [Apium graveolens]|uniref:protein neprosin-like isoform X1 n=1 Tax=Apium graveolens TaxID=4045 RepID=UPI003D78E8C6
MICRLEFRMKLLHCLVVLIFLYLVQCNSAARFSVKKKLKIQNLLKRLNKQPHKSIKSPDGDIIDCIPISHQPAFHHPLLQNHKIQLAPSYCPEGRFDDKKMNSSKSSIGLKPVKQLWHLNGKCAKGTIPVRRTKKGNVLRAGWIKNFGKNKKNINIPGPNSTEHQYDLDIQKHQHAIAYVDGDKYFGAQANINVWQPKVQEPTEFSLSQIWVTKGSFDAGDLNSVEAGWMVSEDLYGDNNTRLFTFWTRDAYKSTGCYNLLCSGFIQISQQMALGASISPVSSYNGAQYDISILIWKDPDGGNWWMKLLNINEVIGYWPASLFTNLADGADMIQWGGEAVNLASGGQHTTTQMGSGHFPGEGFNKASYFKNIQVVDGSNQLKDPDDVKTFTDQSSCYDVQNGKNGQWGTYFYYGGPGRNPKCP